MVTLLCVYIYTHTCVSIYLSNYLSIYLPSYLSIYLSIYLSLSFSFFLSLSIYIHTHKHTNVFKYDYAWLFSLFDFVLYVIFLLLVHPLLMGASRHRSSLWPMTVPVGSTSGW